MYIEDKGSSLRDKGQAGKPRSFAHCQTRSQATIQRGSVSSFVSLVGRGSTIVCLLVIDKRWGLLLHHELNELVIYPHVSQGRVQGGEALLQSIRPSPSWSASRIISSTSSSVSFSPIDVMTWRSSAAEMKPLLSRSKTLKASRISSSESVSFILRAIMVRNSGEN